MLFRDSEKMMTMNTWCAISSVFSCFRLRSSPLSSFFFFLCSALVFPPLFYSPLSVVPSLSRCLPSLFSLFFFFKFSSVLPLSPQLISVFPPYIPLSLCLSFFFFPLSFLFCCLLLFFLCAVPLFISSVPPLAFIARGRKRFLVTDSVHHGGEGCQPRNVLPD